MLDTKPLLLKSDFPALRRRRLDTLQVNLGYLCNLSCTHCHVNAGPKRTELMDKDMIDLVLAFIETHDIKTLDLTGGAPEMNPHFRELVKASRQMGVKVIDRCNLTILFEPGYEDLAQFLADNQVAVVASLPCYSEDTVNKQRGKGVYSSSVEALLALNALGYGKHESLSLDLVYNPSGAFLPPAQEALEADYKRELSERFGIVFNQLLTITNMPISRFGGMLLAKDLYQNYMSLLKDSFSEANLDAVMCKQLISVDWQGYVYDCDFNQMLEMPLRKPRSVIATDKRLTHLRDLLGIDLENSPIVVADHCYGCTAGQGSSCGGALDG